MVSSDDFLKKERGNIWLAGIILKNERSNIWLVVMIWKNERGNYV